MRSTPVVVVFARVPRLGEVKTRLASAVGDARALELYTWLGARVVRALVAHPRDFELVVEFTPGGDASRAAIERWLPGADRYELQHPGDLGARMAHALERELAGGAPRVVLVGTDCVAVDAARIASALAALAHAPCVLGPAHDGGYYLLGATRPLPVFERMRWSTDTVLSETRARLRAADIPHRELAPERDVDTIDDLVTLTPLPDAPRWIASARTHPGDTTQ